MTTTGGTRRTGDDPGTALPLAAAVLDRAAHRRLDVEWLAAAWPAARVLVLDADGQVLVAPGTAGPRLVFSGAAELDDVPSDQRMFLGLDGAGSAVFAVEGALPTVPGARPTTLRDVGHLLAESEADLFSSGLALVNWHRRHRFSPATGAPTTVGDGGWVRLDETGRQWWPRIEPAVIVLVHDGVSGPDGRCLLGHGGAWAAPGARRFSCLAGFVEAGESAEAAVQREVREEAGVTAGQIRYVASQPWPLPCSLMLGFTAYADPTQPVTVDAEEVVDARWFTRRDVGAVYAGERVDLGDGARLLMPTNASIAVYLIKSWLHER